MERGKCLQIWPMLWLGRPRCATLFAPCKSYRPHMMDAPNADIEVADQLPPKHCYLSSTWVSTGALCGHTRRGGCAMAHSVSVS